jgi:hypothetical protein
MYYKITFIAKSINFHHPIAHLNHILYFCNAYTITIGLEIRFQRVFLNNILSRQDHSFSGFVPVRDCVSTWRLFYLLMLTQSWEKQR